MHLNPPGLYRMMTVSDWQLLVFVEEVLAYNTDSRQACLLDYPPRGARQAKIGSLQTTCRTTRCEHTRMHVKGSVYVCEFIRYGVAY